MAQFQVCDGSSGPFSSTQETGAYDTLKSSDSIQMDPSFGPLIENALNDCSQDEIKLGKTVCEKLLEEPVNQDSVAYAFCCNGLSVCSKVTMKPMTEEEIRERLKWHISIKLKNEKTCSGIPIAHLTPSFLEELLFLSDEKMQSTSLLEIKKFLSTCTSEHKKALQEQCDKYIETPSFKNGNLDTFGYGVCCQAQYMCPLQKLPKLTKEQVDMMNNLFVSLLTNVKTCSDMPTGLMDEKPDTIDFLVPIFEEKMPPDFLKNKKSFATSCKPGETKILRGNCEKFYAKSDKKGDKDTVGYGFCCETLQVCPPSEDAGNSPFYTHTWFFAVFGGVGLLLIGIIGIVVFLLCCRKKRGGGKIGGGMKNSKKSTKKSNSNSEALF